ncbi:MAG: hypothetical protein LBQ92_00275 [Propionibacteriaceae bacterium]|jgi:hypothetical protein|nr:hypothetical protein [Propionibacteriaceae bacterium]
MVWVWVFLGIFLAMLVMLVCFTVWLAHKAADVFSELEMLGQRGSELAELLGKIDFAALEPAE